MTVTLTLLEIGAFILGIFAGALVWTVAFLRNR